MAPKRQKDKRRQDHHHHPRRKRHEQDIPLSERLLAFLSRQQEPLTLAAVCGGLGLPEQERNLVKEALGVLEKAGQVSRSGQCWQAAAQRDLLRARLSMTSKGFGFAVLDGNVSRQQKDVFIPASGLNGAGHGDTVLVRMLGSSSSRPEGEVVEIEKRAYTHLCGIYVGGRSMGEVTPDSDKLPFTVRVKRSESMDAEDGMAVLVEVLDYGTPQRQPLGRVVEVLGPPDSVPVQLRMAVQQFDLPRVFPPEVEAEVAALVPLTELDKGRRDLRHLRHVTIDGATAKDFDDAVCVQKTQQGYRLFVSIADVSHYVRPGTALDREAFQRGTSVYLPNMVLPMLPERLSNDLCSLVPDQDRPAFTAILDFDEQGRRTGAKFAKSLILSHCRFTYDTVNELIYLRDKAARQTHKAHLPMLEKAKELAALLAVQRSQRGSLGFTIPEADIRLDGDRIASVSRMKRNQAHLLVEEFMLAANEAVAEELDKAKLPVLFRVHENPDPEKVRDFIATAAAMGVVLPKHSIGPAWFAEVLAKTKGSPAEYVVNNLLLRTMQRARYTPENLGHFGLAAEYYLHFTSPIRRYPDLVAHRVLQNLLTKKKTAPVLSEGETLEAAGGFLSGRERTAVETERDAQARLAVLFLRERVTEEFDAVISGVTSFGLFVELVECLISGAVPVKEMKDDWYRHDSTGHQLLGERTGRRYRLGDSIRVRLVQVDALSRKLTFAVAS
uniref:ribonuclease R n=1 Tax=Candidatus Electronema sp. TaxID=2698783 RepID=UPI004056B00F